MRGGGRGGEGEGERNGCQAADEKLCLKCQSAAYLCVFSGLCAHSDGVTHQRTISGDGGEEERCRNENLHLLGSCMQTGGSHNEPPLPPALF